MAEEKPTTTENEELTLESIADLEPDALTDEQKTFLEENKADLTEEQATKFGVKKEEEEKIDVEKLEPETRGGKKPEVTTIKKEEKADEEDDEDLLDPDDQRKIGKFIDKRVGPIEEKLQQQRDELEVNAYLIENPTFAKYKPAMMKYISHPAYAQIPVQNIAAIVAAKDMQKLGAQKERDAARKAAETKNAGNTAKTIKTDHDWRTASKEEYEAKKAEVLSRRGS